MPGNNDKNTGKTSEANVAGQLARGKRSGLNFSSVPVLPRDSRGFEDPEALLDAALAVTGADRPRNSRRQQAKRGPSPAPPLKPKREVRFSLGSTRTDSGSPSSRRRSSHRNQNDEDDEHSPRASTAVRGGLMMARRLVRNKGAIGKATSPSDLSPVFMAPRGEGDPSSSSEEEDDNSEQEEEMVAQEVNDGDDKKAAAPTVEDRVEEDHDDDHDFPPPVDNHGEDSPAAHPEGEEEEEDGALVPPPPRPDSPDAKESDDENRPSQDEPVEPQDEDDGFPAADGGNYDDDDDDDREGKGYHMKATPAPRKSTPRGGSSKKESVLSHSNYDWSSLVENESSKKNGRGGTGQSKKKQKGRRGDSSSDDDDMSGSDDGERNKSKSKKRKFAVGNEDSDDDSQRHKSAKKKRKNPSSDDTDEDENVHITPARKKSSKKDRSGKKKPATFTPKGYALPQTYRTIQVSDMKDEPDPGEIRDGLRRSRRVRIKPLAYWKNETVEYGPNLEFDSRFHDETLYNMPVPKAIRLADPTPYKKRIVSKSKKRAADAKKLSRAAAAADDDDKSVREADMEPFDSTKLKKRYKFMDGESAYLWDDTETEISDMKVIAFNRNLRPRPLPLLTGRNPRGRHDSNLIGSASQSFNVLNPGNEVYPGYLMGNLLLPPRAIKDAECVGSCAQTFTVVDCQPNSLEVAYGDPEADQGVLDPQTAQRFLLGPGDMFRIPPRNCYRLENHSRKKVCALTWTIIRNIDLPYDEEEDGDDLGEEEERGEGVEEEEQAEVGEGKKQEIAKRKVTVTTIHQREERERAEERAMD